MELFTVKPGYEKCAASECESVGYDKLDCYSGYVIAPVSRSCVGWDFCFSSWHLLECEPVTFQNDRDGLHRAVEWFCDKIRDVDIHHEWPLVWLRFTESGYLPDGVRAQKVATLLKKRVSRVSRMARTDYPAVGIPSDGLFIVETGDSIFCSRSATFYGQKRMKNDVDAPSRSFLKIEEAFSVFAVMPVAGEIVVDLGAAPGGWSYAASKRGAHVMAIDNGPLKKGAVGNPNIEHLREDAFKWLPEQPVDWLFCDIVEEPSIVLALIKKWLNLKLCRFAIINFKCGHTAPDGILRLVRGASGISCMVQTCLCRHLYHDRNEFTVMLKV